MHGLIGSQVAFCFVVLFLGGLFVKTFEELSHQPMGFSSERILLVETTRRISSPLLRGHRCWNI